MKILKGFFFLKWSYQRALKEKCEEFFLSQGPGCVGGKCRDGWKNKASWLEGMIWWLLSVAKLTDWEAPWDWQSSTSECVGRTLADEWCRRGTTKTGKECGQHHPVGWGLRRNGSRERESQPVLQALSKSLFLLLLPVEIRLKILQSFSMDSDQRRSRELPGLQPQTINVSLVLRLPAFLLLLTGSQPLQYVSSHK